MALDFAAFCCFTKVFVQCASVSQNGCRSSASIQLVASGRDLSSLKVVDRNRAGQLVASGLGPSPLSSGFPRVSPAAAPGRHEVRAGARLQPKLSKLPPGAGYRLCSAFDVTELPPWMTSSNSPCLGCRNLLSRLLRSSWVETGSSADSLHVRKAGSSAGSSHRPQVQKAEASGCSSLLQSEADSSPQVQKAEASGYRVITPGPKGGGIRLPLTSSVGVISRLLARAKGGVIRRLLTSTPGPKGGGIRLLLTSSVRGRFITPGPKGGGIRLPSHHPRSKRRRHQATPHFFSQRPRHQATPHFFNLFRCKSPSVVPRSGPLSSCSGVS